MEINAKTVAKFILADEPVPIIMKLIGKINIEEIVKYDFLRILLNTNSPALGVGLAKENIEYLIKFENFNLEEEKCTPMNTATMEAVL